MSDHNKIAAFAPPVLRLRGATLIRGGVPVLENIDLTIAQGEHTALLGPNGSGKTSLIKLLTRECYPLARPDRHPAVEIFGRALWDVAELRSLLGIVTSDLHQTFAGAGEITGREAVLSGFFGSVGVAPHHVVEPDMPDRADAALRAVGAHRLADRPMGELSTGEARRVLIARALVCGPQALLLDEPTAGLDIVAMRQFLDTIRAVIAGGVTVILVTHHTEEIVPEINRVVLLRDGRVFRDGPKSEVLTSAILSALYGVPVRVAADPRAGTFTTRIR